MKKKFLFFLTSLVSLLVLSSKVNAQFSLESNSNAPNVLYLDFDGETLTGSKFNTDVNATSLIFPSANFSNAQITEAWEITAEDFAPFNINVTTNRFVYNNTPESNRAIVIITSQMDSRVIGNSDNFQFNGAVALTNSWANGKSVALVAYQANAFRAAFYAGNIISHESGHIFGLKHKGRNTNDYVGPIGPDYAVIMGDIQQGTPPKYIQWSKGEYSGAIGPTRDDIATILANASVNLRGDEYGNTFNNATQIGVDGIRRTSGTAYISSENDIDIIYYYAGAGSHSYTLTVSNTTSNLLPQITLYNSAGVEIKKNSAPITFLGNNLYKLETGNQPEGYYYIKIEGIGKGNPSQSGFSSYGSLGKYKFEGTLGTTPNNTNPGPRPTVGGNSNPDPTPTSPSGQFYVVNRQTGKKLAPQNSNDGAELIQLDASNNSNIAKWTQVNSSNGYFYLKNVSTGKYFRPATSSDGSILEQRPSTWAGDYTQWKQVNSTNGYFYLQNRQTNLYFRPNTDANNSTMVQRPTSYAGSYTQWKFEATSATSTPTPDPTPNPTPNPTPTPTGIPFNTAIGIQPVIASWISTTQKFDYISARFNEGGILKSSKIPSSQALISIGEWESFIVEDGGNGNVRVKVKNFGAGYKYLVVSGTSISATGTSATAAEAQFTWTTVGNASEKRFGLKSVATGKYLQIPQNQNGSITLNVNGSQRGAWELFQYVEKSSAKSLNALVKFTKVYPNPLKTGGVLNIDTNKLQDLTIQLNNVSGKSILNRVYKNTDSVKINISDLKVSGGFYLLKITSGNKTQIEKIILE